MKLELKFLASYLPYGLNLYFEDTKKQYPLVVHNSSVSMVGGFVISEVLNEPMLKPILQPMSDFKDINSKAMNELNCDLSTQMAIRDLANREIGLSSFSLTDAEYCFYEHIDIYRLIEQNLAISIHDLEK